MEAVIIVIAFGACLVVAGIVLYPVLNFEKRVKIIKKYKNKLLKTCFN